MKKLLLSLIALFAMVSMATAQRAWAYDLGLTSSGDSYTFTFKAVTAANATLVFDEAGVEAGTIDLGSVSAGVNTVTKTADELLTVIKKSGDFNWSVKMSGEAIAAGSTLKEVTDQTRGIYDFYNMMDVLVDNNPESDYFGKIYIQAALNGASDGATARSKAQKAGLFIYDQELNELNPTSNVGIMPTLPSGYTLGDNRNKFHRLEIDSKTGNLVYCYNVSGSPAVFSIDRANPTGLVTNLIDGISGFTQTCAHCFDADGTLYVMDLASSQGTIYKVVDGQKTAFSETTGKWVNASISLAADGRGGVWVAHNRGQLDTYYQLAHVSASGVTDYKVYNGEANGFTGGSARGALAYDAERHILAQGRGGAVELFNVTYNASGVPTLTKFAVTPSVGNNIDGLHFDYAGDLYVVNSSKEKFQKFVVPTTNNTCTVPAKKAQVITLVSTTPEYTITVNCDNAMGSVTGAGTYLEGNSVTLKATAKTGYVFVNWTKGAEVLSAENPYSFPAAEDVTITANFTKASPRAWAYGLKVTEEGDNYKFTFNATTAGTATLLFADIDGNPLAPTSYDAGTVEAGANTVLVAKIAFTENKDVYWSVKMDGATIPAISEITDASKGIYNFYLPQGVAVDNNPESPTFSKIYIAESTDGASDGGSDRADNQKRGIFIYDQTLAELNPTSNVGILPNNVTLENTTRHALKRIAINPKTNEVAFAYNATPAAVWAVSTENVAGEATNLLAGLGFDYCNSLCFDENGILYIFDNGAGYPAKGSLYKIVNGEKHTIFSENSKYGNADNSLASDGRGGLWIYQNRGQLDAFNQLSHINANGEIDFEVNSTTPHDFASLNTSRGAMAYNPREDILAIGIGASGTIGVSLYQVTYNPSTGVPSLEYIGATPSLGKNVEGIAFDYAGDLYALSANAERFYKFTLPTNENTCTVPAPSSQKLVLGTQCEVTVTINDPAMGSVEGAGQHEKGAEVTLTAKPVAHHRFVNWTGDKTSTDNPFKFTIEGNVALTANFEATPQWTITVTANDDSMGTVSGGGTYDEGQEVTIAATPNATYRFVKWSDDVTDATRTFSAAENLTLQAIFEKVPNRAWAYDLSQVADGDNYKFSFVATTAGEATLLFADKDGNELVAPYAVGTVAAGANTVTLAKTTFEGVTKDVYWSVKMDGEEITAVAEITDQSKGIYDFYSMRGVVVDNDPNSTDFGKIYVEMSLNGASDGGSERTKTQTAGIFIYDQQLNELNTPSNVGYKPTMPSSYTELGTAAEAMKRLAINPTNGNLAFGNNISGEGSVWSVSRNNLTGAATNIIEGATGIDKVNAICYDENGSLYVLANITLGSSKYNLYKFTDGVQTELTLQGKKIFVDPEVAMASDGRGGIWIAQNRSGIGDYKILSHVNVAEDKLDFVVETGKDYSDWFGGNCYRAAVAYNPNTKVLAVQGVNKVSLFSVSYDAAGVPSITKLVQTPTVGKNIDGLAFDYAGDLYVVNSSAEKLFKFTIPTTDNICTVPAPASQKLVLGTQCEVTVTVNDPAMGSVEGAGQYEKGATVELEATANKHYQFVNWTKGAEVLSTENPYSFTVQEDVTIIANFAELPTYTITVQANNNAMGSVEGGGTVHVGESVEIKATPNSGHAFVKWDDGNTEATRTVEVVGDKTYTAIFQAMNPRAWAYDLRMIEDGDNYKFTFKATSTGTATLLFTNKAGTPVAPTSYTVGNVEAGEKSVTIAKSEFGGTEDIYWSVQMDGAAIENMIEITDASGNYDFFMPQDVKVDNSPNSMYFGQVYVAAAVEGAARGGTQKRGIFVYDQKLAELNTPNVGYLPANVTLTDATRHAIHRLAVNPINGYVAFAYNVSGSSAVWSMNPANMSGNAVNLIDNSITAANSICFDEEGALYVMDNANAGSIGGQIYKEDENGKLNLFAAHNKDFQWANADNALAPDGRGGLWIAQNRWQVDGYPVLSHVDKDGLVDFAVTSSSSEALKALFPYDDNNASYRGQCAYYAAEDILAFGGNKEAVLFKVTYDINNVPTNLEKLMSTGKLGTNIDGLAFDYAGDLYVASETTHRMYKFVIPTADNTCTVPAPASQVIKKEQRYTVTVSVNDDAMGTATGGGEYKAGETIMLTATANTGYRFVNWTKDAEEVSTSASFEYTVPAEDVTLTANFAPLPEITYELNGGVWNKYGWTSKKDMYNALLDDWRAYSGSTRTNIPYEDQLGIGKSKAGIPTTIYTTEDREQLMALLLTDATYAPKWGWLATYVDAVAVAQSKATQPTTSAGHLVYALGNFFGEDNVNSTNWMGAVDFTGEEAHLTAFAPYWGQTFPMPTQPTEEVILNAPYKEGYLFDGWYATSNFSGSEVTAVDPNTDGTLYAKWIEHKYTRDVTNGHYGTVCLPYGSSDYTGAEFYEIAYLEMDGENPKTLWLDEVDGALEAGKPYIFKATSTLLIVNYEGDAELNPVAGKAGLTGIFEAIPTTNDILEGNYMIAQNRFWLCGADCWLDDNRAYINKDILHSNTTPIAEIPGRRRVSMGAAGENATTGVNNLTEGGAIAPNVEGTYDVLGRKFTEPNGTGFYIVNGKKVVIVK